MMFEPFSGKDTPMIITSENRQEDQARRLKLKSQDTLLANMATQGAGLSPWESEVLVDMVQEVYFSDPTDRPLTDGQIRYSCVAAREGAGKPIAECQLQTVVLSLLHRDDLSVTLSSTALRQQRVMRMSEEAREQGGLLSQEDLARLLTCHVATIRRDIKSLRKTQEIVVPTRGQVKDIGPGVSHKAVIVKQWLQGKEPLQVARDTHHSLNAAERYIQHFSRTAFLKRKGFFPLQIALTIGISTTTVKSYLELYETTHWMTQYRSRYEEIDIIGVQHFEAQDEKKGLYSPRKERKKLGSVS